MTLEVTECALVGAELPLHNLALTSEVKMSSLPRNSNNNQQIRIDMRWKAVNEGITTHNKTDKILIRSLVRCMQLLLEAAPGVSSKNLT
jgi:hypothetical protein